MIFLLASKVTFPALAKFVDTDSKTFSHLELTAFSLFLINGIIVICLTSV